MWQWAARRFCHGAVDVFTVGLFPSRRSKVHDYAIGGMRHVRPPEHFFKSSIILQETSLLDLICEDTINRTNVIHVHYDTYFEWDYMHLRISARGWTRK